MVSVRKTVLKYKPLKGKSLGFVNVAKKQKPKPTSNPGGPEYVYIVLRVVISDLMRKEPLKYTVYLHGKYEGCIRLKGSSWTCFASCAGIFHPADWVSPSFAVRCSFTSSR